MMCVMCFSLGVVVGYVVTVLVKRQPRDKFGRFVKRC